VSDRKRGRFCCVVLTLTLTLAALPMEASAQNNIAFKVSAGSLAAALRQFARQTDVEVLFNQQLVVGHRTNGFSGVATAEVALEQLLANSGLTATVSRSGALLVVAKNDPQAISPQTALSSAQRPPVMPGASEVIGAGPLVEPVVVVTGSLLVRDGNRSPTPVTMMDINTLQEIAPTNIPDGLNQLPQFSNSRSESQNSQTGTAISPAAGNYLNLRNLGIVRSLILLDGQRIPPTSYEGTVDTNVLPQILVQRVDVVTAGASATYGSDALTGVVNFVLDKKFTGLKGSVQGGISEEGDNRNYRLTLAGGAPVLDGRGHVLFSVEHYQSDGIDSRADRPLYALFPMAYGNGTTIPYRTEFNARVSNATFGGLALSGPLNFFKFDPGGTISPFNRGSSQVGGVQIGGDGSYTTPGSLIGSVRTEQAFARASYDITENITGFIQATFGEARNRFAHVGNDSRFANMTIFSGNAFLRPEVQAILTANNTPSFTFSRHTVESGRKVVDTLSTSGSIFAGLDGKFGGDWTWKATYSGGESILRAQHSRNPENTRLTAALDAVRDTGGNIVCRVTLTNPGVFPGCVVPLLKDLPFIQSLEFNGAGRVTDYSTSGRVETWKAGVSYVPVGGLRFRGTLSRDIRAPTLYELFAAPALTAATFDDVHTNQTYVITQLRSGNPALQPEIGRTTTFGLVVQPRWLRGFTVAIDYYDIDIKGAISTRTGTQINQDCEDGGETSPSCALLARPGPFSDRSAANQISRISLVPQNLAFTSTHGVDVEAGYRFPLSHIWDGTGAVVTLRALANYTQSYKTLETASSPVQQQAGLGGAQNTNSGNPKLRTTISATYATGPLRVSLQQRYIGALRRSLQPNIVYVDNDIEGIAYYNAAVTYRFNVNGQRAEVFVNVNNLLDKAPPLVPYINGPGLIYPTLQSLYDVVGRSFVLGVRVRM
jgi:outer membrane receptor protein involved in Fe transport